jgi:hypothetical protein
MFSDLTTSYEWNDASLEIIIILWVAFILWVILWSLLKKVDCKKVTALSKNKKINTDDLKIIDWIWAKIEKLLNDNEIYTFDDLIDIDTDDLLKILEENVKKYKKLNYKTWLDQAKLASNFKWWELKEYQIILNENIKS